MKKIANLILAAVFTLSIVLAVINTAATTGNANNKSVYTLMNPVKPPIPPSEYRKKRDGGGIN